MLTSSSSTMSFQVLESDRQIVSQVSATTNSTRCHESKSPYQVDQQVKFLHLEAEVESLLQQLQNIKQQRLATTK